ncbi:MAG: hypothetical protein CSYNP_01496 [Syntrophus sp. SKADARSKE-3]|nr:hypothetical protein [Syntrophus sp. SKADARSKE-3]
MKRNFLATGIGSMPFDGPDEAVRLILSRLPEAPHWPQLPRLGLREQMEVQYSEHMPCAVLDEEKKRLYFETSGDYSETFAQFYETYLSVMDPDEGSGNCLFMAPSPAYSRGFDALLNILQENSSVFPFIKCQIVGPCSFALTVVDERKRAIYYNEEFRDVIVKVLSMTARGQIQALKNYADQVICFIDEPILSAFGSSTYVAVRREDVVALLREMIDAVHADGALAGIHCCGNTEWSILIDAGVDIISFDAFQYGETIAMYAEAVKAYLLNGGVLAWGILPTSTAIHEQTAEGLAGRLEGFMDCLAAKGIDKGLITNQAMITPSCGTGSMTPGDACLVYERLFEVSNLMKTKYQED